MPYRHSHIAKRDKFGRSPAEERTLDGRTFHSKLEMQRYQSLMFRMAHERPPSVRKVEFQPRFELGVPENVYVADFLVVMADGRVIIEDVKGLETPKFRRDLKLWKSYGPYELHIVKRGKRRRSSALGFAWETQIVPGGRMDEQDQCQEVGS